MLDLIGINLYLGTDRLLRPRGGRGFSQKCGVTKLYPPPKKKVHMKIVPPLVITIFKMQPLPYPPPSPPFPRCTQGKKS